jgi:flavodoxin
VDPDTAWLAAARHHIALREYRASENAVGLQAPSRRHALRTYFEPTGIRVVDRVAEGSPQLLALRLEQMGRVNSLAPVAPGKVVSDGNRVEIRRGSLLEWYVNSPAGLEQGFTLSERTEGEGPLVLDLLLEGAEASRSGESVRIATATGRQLAYGELKAFDAAGVPLPVTLLVPSVNRIQLRVDDTNAVYPVVIDPMLVAAAGTQLESDQRGALFGFSVAGAGDVNGDGYADVIIGGWRYDAGETDEGAAFIFHGSAAGIADATPATAHTRLESDQAGAEMGEYVAGAGDVNGDGYDDVIVGALYYDAGETDEGAAFIFHGSATGIANGTPATAQTRLESDQASAEMGANLGGAGDVNGDGYDDVIVGAWQYDAGETDEGAAFIFHGSATGIANGTPATARTRFTGEQAGAQMGISVAGAGDVNGDGFADVVVGAHTLDAGEIDEGAAFVFHGSAAGIADGNPATAHARFEGNQVEAWMGVSVDGAGDVNGDGYDDVIVGARRYDAGEIDEGVAFVFHGSAAGIADGNPATARTRLAGDQLGAWMGHSVAGAGDVNGDGYADVIVGASRYDAGEPDTGAAFLFLGSASGIADASSASAYVAFENDQANARMGYGASGAGDVNGDGFGDVVVGSYNYDCGQKNEGAAFVFLGSDLTTTGRTGLKTGPPRDSCEPLPLEYSVKKVAAALIVLVGGAGFLVFLIRRRGRSSKPAS